LSPPAPRIAIRSLSRARVPPRPGSRAHPKTRPRRRGRARHAGKSRPPARAGPSASTVVARPAICTRSNGGLPAASERSLRASSSANSPRRGPPRAAKSPAARGQPRDAVFPIIYVEGVALYTADSKERVRDAVDFVELVSAHTELRRAGPARYEGRCPFHDE